MIQSHYYHFGDVRPRTRKPIKHATVKPWMSRADVEAIERAEAKRERKRVLAQANAFSRECGISNALLTLGGGCEF